MSTAEHHTLHATWAALGGDADQTGRVKIVGEGDLPSAFAVTGFAAGTVAAAALAVAEYAGTDAGVTVDRRLASLWFGVSFQPVGWTAPPAWDPVAGDYRTSDGWIRLHTNAPHHRQAALAVLGVPAERQAVADAVRTWQADELETAVVARNGCAAAMRSVADWAGHPQGQAVAGEPLVAWQVVAPAAHRLPRPDPHRPLAGLRVLDLTRVLAGPVATRFLAGFGADVLRIDPPDWDEPGVVPDVTLGKRCARLDLRTAEGTRTLRRLLAEADVFVHGYRPGALDRLGLGADERKRVRPGLVDVSLDAYGWTGPWAGRRGFDSRVQMSRGIAHEGMWRFGRDRPTPLPVQALDHGTGYLLAAAVVRCLTELRRSGSGQTARASLARTAALLPASGQGNMGGTLDKPGAEDFSDTAEATVWGPVRRLRPPAIIDGISMRWDRPAGPLGTDAAEWLK